MTADWGIVFGLTGIGVGLLSLVYARTQAIHARRQADAAYVATSLQLQREMSDRINKARMELMRDPAAAKMYLAAIPELARLVPEGSDLDTIVMIRNAIDGLQDMYFLRKRSIVDGHHWRSWTSSFAVIVRMPIARPIFDNAVARDALDPEFVAFLRPLFDGQLLADPRDSDPAPLI